MKIVIVEDNKKIRDELCEFLSKYHYETYAIVDFEHAVEDILAQDAHLVLLDLNLPVYDGAYLCQEIRKQSKIPIIVVTSRDSEADELMSMTFGADDFITKPYHTGILLARINAVLKRAYPAGGRETIEWRGLTFHLSSGIAGYEEREIVLSKNEQKILYHLMKRKGEILTRDELINALWQSDEFIDDNTLTVNINRLRKRLEELGLKNYIQTRRGQGYLV